VRINGVSASLRTGSPSEIRLHYASRPDIGDVVVSIGVFTSRGEGALHLSSEISGYHLGSVPPSGDIVCRLDRVGLLPGRYTVNVHVTASGTLADWVVDAATVDVAEGDLYGTGRLPPPGYGSVAVPQAWKVEVA
jgi:lipopolysaccharide transport system ATP-binding protein